MRTFGIAQVSLHRYRTLPLLPPPPPQSMILSPLGSWQGLAFRSCLVLQVPAT